MEQTTTHVIDAEVIKKTCAILTKYKREQKPRTMGMNVLFYVYAEEANIMKHEISEDNEVLYEVNQEIDNHIWEEIINIATSKYGLSISIRKMSEGDQNMIYELSIPYIEKWDSEQPKVNCPICKGTGKIEVTMVIVSEKTKKVSKITCHDCHGEKVVSPIELSEIRDKKEYADKMWCKCGNPSGNTHYWEDGQGEWVTKHHWTCADCGKVKQIG